MADSDKTVVVEGEAEVNKLKVSEEISDLKKRVEGMEKAILEAQKAAQRAADAAQKAADDAALAAASQPFNARNIRRKAITDDEEQAAAVVTAGGAPTVAVTDILTVALARQLHSALGHTHVNMPTTGQKKALDLANLSPTNRAVGLTDLDEAFRLTDKFPVGYKRFNAIQTGTDPSVNVTVSLSGELVAANLASEGLVDGLRSHIRINETQTASFAGNFVIFGKLRQVFVILLRRPPQANAATLVVALNPNVTSYIIDKPDLLVKNDTIVVASTNRASIQNVLDLTRGGYFINPPDAVPASLPAGTKVYKLISGEIFVKQRVGAQWVLGGNGGLAVTRQSVHALAVGNQLYINPGQVNEELVTILSITPSGLDDRDPIDIRFVSNLAFDHDGGEPVVRIDLVEVASSRTDLFLDLLSLDDNGNEVPQTINTRKIDVLMPYRFQNKNLPVQQMQMITEFLHLAEGGALGFLGMVQGISIGVFGVANQPVVHNLSLANYGVLTEQIWDLNASTVGNRGIGLVSANAFTVENSGANVTSEFDWMAHSLISISPMMASGLAKFAAGGAPTTIHHNLGVANYFVAIEIQADQNISSIGVWGVDNVQANSFEIKHTGSNNSTPFRWTIFNTGALPRGGLLITGQGQFPGSGLDLVIAHNANQPRYFLKITPRYNPTIAGVGAYGVHEKTLNSIKVSNGGQDSSTEFFWAMFIPPE